MTKKTAAQQINEILAKKNKKKIEEELGPCRKWEFLNGKKYEYPCFNLKKGHIHALDCVTEEMWNAASEEAYRNDKV